MEEQILVTRYTCQRCDHKWQPRSDAKPVACPRCKSPYWNRTRKNPSKKTEDEKQ